MLGLSSAWLFLIAITNVTITAILACNIATYTERFRRHQDLFVWGIVYRCCQIKHTIYHGQH